MPAMTAVPAYARTHTRFPLRHVRPHGVDDAHDLVTRHPGVLNAGKCAGDGEHVTVADAARLHLDPHLPWLRIGYIPLDHFKTGIGLGYLNDLHSLHGGIFTGVAVWLDVNAIAHRHGVPLIVDNTVPTPYLS